MKKRNTTIFAFLLLAAVGMGVGYAALTDNLTVGGKATVGTEQALEDWDLDVSFTDAKIKSQTTVNNAAAIEQPSYTENNDNVFLTVSGLDSKEDTVVIELTITNNNENYDAKITADTEKAFTNDNDAQFDISVAVVDDLAEYQGGTATIEVTIKLKVQPTESLVANFSVGYVATSTEHQN